MLVGRLAFAALLSGVAAQVGVGVPGVYNSLYGGSHLCNRSFADANLTGVVTFNPNVAQGQQSSGGSSFSTPISWAVTTYQPDNADTSHSEQSLWVSTNTVNYSDNFDLGYDACYFRLTPISINTVLRGQDDDGTCSSTLNSACVNDLQTAASTYAMQLVGTGNTLLTGNLTSSSLPGVCSSIADMTNKNFPRSCAPFLDGAGQLSGGLPGFGGPLTGPTSLVSASKCTTNNGDYHLMWSQFEAANNGIYVLASWQVTPLLTTYMPIADSARPVTLAFAKSVMSCLRSKDVNKGSQIPQNAPPAAPLNATGSSSNSTESSAQTSTNMMLGGGAIAGIVIGAIFGIALVVGLLLFARKRRAAKKSYTRQQSTGSDYGDMELTHDKGPNGTIAEVSGYSKVGEAPDTNSFHEMHVPPVELHDKRLELNELPA